MSEADKNWCRQYPEKAAAEIARLTENLHQCEKLWSEDLIEKDEQIERLEAAVRDAKKHISPRSDWYINHAKVLSDE